MGLGLGASVASLIRLVAEPGRMWRRRKCFCPAPASSIPTDTSSILGGKTKDAGRSRATHTQRIGWGWGKRVGGSRRPAAKVL